MKKLSELGDQFAPALFSTLRIGGRLAWFTACMFVGGLLQLWFQAGDQLVVHGSVDYRALCGKGELAFFSTALIASSTFTLLSSNRLFAIGSADGIISLVLGVVPFAISVWSYLSSVRYTKGFEDNLALVDTYIFIQATCALLSGFYALYVAAITGALIGSSVGSGAPTPAGVDRV